MDINKAIFITNIFAQSHPEKHTALWNQFEKEVPLKKRSGTFGVDNLSYVSWLKKKKDPVFLGFIDEHVSIITI